MSFVLAINPIEDDGLWPPTPTPELDLFREISSGDVESRYLEPLQRVKLLRPPLIEQSTPSIRVVQSLRGVMHIPEDGRNIGIVEVASPKGFGVALTEMVASPHDGNMPSILGVAVSDIPFYLTDEYGEEGSPIDRLIATLSVADDGEVSVEANRRLQAVTANELRSTLDDGFINPATWYMRPSSVMRAIQAIKPKRNPDRRSRKIVQNGRILPA